MKRIALSRRNFLKSALAVAAYIGTGNLISRDAFAAVTEAPAVATKIPGWYRGHMHQHSYWSDGSAFLEEACSLYRDSGYEFLIPSDHNHFQDDANRWLVLDDRKAKLQTRCQTRYSFSWETKEENGQKLVRLRTFDEVSAALNQDERFLLIPGFELTSSDKSGVQVHSNLINTRLGISKETIDDVPGQIPNMYLVDQTDFAESKKTPRPDSVPTLQWHRDVAKKFLSDKPAEQSIWFLNHPDWRYYDVQPEWVVDQPDLRFFEVINCGPAPDCGINDKYWTTDKFWDIVNAFRAEKGQALLNGVANDDTHNYSPFYDDFPTAPGGFTMVRAPKLETNSIMAALNKGDCYASTGVFLDDVQFDTASKTLEVRVHAEPETEYRIDFIGTRAGFDKTFTTIHEPGCKKYSQRDINVYSEQIGQTFQSVTGTRGAYKMSDDDLYVRAKIVALKPAPRQIKGKPESQTAWTQPVFG